MLKGLNAENRMMFALESLLYNVQERKRRSCVYRNLAGKGIILYIRKVHGKVSHKSQH